MLTESWAEGKTQARSGPSRFPLRSRSGVATAGYLIHFDPAAFPDASSCQEGLVQNSPRMNVEQENAQYQLLVVDDDPDNRDMLSRRLEKRGFRVLQAEDGKQALEEVEREKIDLVLLDIDMPVMDGIETLKRLRQQHSPSALPVVMQTAKSTAEDQVETAELGANDHVVKPLNFKIVLAKVRALLKVKAASDAQRATGSTELRAGVVVAEKYRLEEPIGSGTFGTVFRACHLKLEQDVAIKFLQPSVTATEESRRRFEQEGIATAKVRHPNAVSVTDFGVTKDGVAYLVMELLDGIPLAQELKEWRRLTPRRVGELLEPICDVLTEVHSAGLVHRDIKPENVFLHQTRRGEVVKVLDFGIAKLVGENFTEQNLTAEGWVLGTPAYMAPERVSNRKYDGRADVYSLGVMLFEMLSGRRPFVAVDSDPMSMIMRHVRDPAPPLSSVWPEAPPELEQIVASTLQKEPVDRPTAAELAEAFARALNSLESRGVTVAPAPMEEAPEPAPTVGSPGVVDVGSGANSAVDASAPTISIRREVEKLDGGDMQGDIQGDMQGDIQEEGWLGRWVKKLKGSFS